MTIPINEYKWAFIINPVAGNGKSIKVRKTLEKQLSLRDIKTKIIESEAPGHASELALQLAKQNYNPIIAVGGDGTLNEVAGALWDFPDITLGIIPAGTGNDFSHILGMPEDFKQEHWDTFFEINSHKIDIGRCNGNMFFNGMGIGFDAQVAAENYTADGMVKQGNKGKYIWHIIKNLLFFKEDIMHLQGINNKEKMPYFLSTISIGRRYAGGFYLTPKAYGDDGLLDICIIEPINLWQRINILLKVGKGEHLSHPKVNYHQTKNIFITLDHKTAFHIDGELFFDDKFAIEILPAQINFIYMPKGSHYLSNTK